MSLHRRNGEGLRGRRMAGRVERLEERRLLAVTGAGWSTYLGGSEIDTAGAVATDAFGNVYVAGYTSSSGWTQRGSDTSYNGAQDGFIVKITPSGALAWSSYLGGVGSDAVAALVVDSLGNVYVGGRTDSAGLASGASGTSLNGSSDGFLMRINANGGVAWTRYIGGSGEDGVSALVVDSSGKLYVAGTTNSSEWASGGFDTSYNGGDYDTYIAEIDADGTLVWSSYLGGSRYDTVRGLAVDGNGAVYVAGWTTSSAWIGGTNLNGPSDGFLAKIHADGTLAWSRYLGGSSYDKVNAVAVDGSGNVYVAGDTSSAGWVGGGGDTSFTGVVDAFVAKVNADGALAWSSYLGGPRYERADALGVDGLGNVWVAGLTEPSDWVAIRFDTSMNEPYKGFIARMSADGALAWSMYIGGIADDAVNALAVDPSGSVYVVGQTSYSGWVSGGFDTSFGEGYWDGFVARLAPVSVQGTEGADTIGVSTDGTQYVVTVNGVATRYDQQAVLSLRVDGLGGDDVITIGPEVGFGVEVYGGEGNDSILGGSGNCSLYGGAGNDSLMGWAGADLIEGGEGNDTLKGADGNDVLVGHDGADSLNGGRGEDELYGNGGNDTLYGGDGNDLVHGQGDRDLLHGEGGNDTLRGALGEDQLQGGEGNDQLYGGDGSDWIGGGGGGDYIEGKGKADTIWGGSGNDTIWGGAGSDRIYAEDGEDWVDVGVSAAFRDSVDGGAGNDTVWADGEDVLSGVEVVILG